MTVYPRICVGRGLDRGVRQPPRLRQPPRRSALATASSNNRRHHMHPTNGLQLLLPTSAAERECGSGSGRSRLTALARCYFGNARCEFSTQNTCIQVHTFCPALRTCVPALPSCGKRLRTAQSSMQTIPANSASGGPLRTNTFL